MSCVRPIVRVRVSLGVPGAPVLAFGPVSFLLDPFLGALPFGPTPSAPGRPRRRVTLTYLWIVVVYTIGDTTLVASGTGWLFKLEHPFHFPRQHLSQ